MNIIYNTSDVHGRVFNNSKNSYTVYVKIIPEKDFIDAKRMN